MSELPSGDVGMKLLEIAKALDVSKQRAHLLIREAGLEPLQQGKSGRGTGSTYRTADVIRLIEKHLRAAEAETERWRERLARLKGVAQYA